MDQIVTPLQRLSEFADSGIDADELVRFRFLPQRMGIISSRSTCSDVHSPYGVSNPPQGWSQHVCQPVQTALSLSVLTASRSSVHNALLACTPSSRCHLVLCKGPVLSHLSGGQVPWRLTSAPFLTTSAGEDAPGPHRPVRSCRGARPGGCFAARRRARVCQQGIQGTALGQTAQPALSCGRPGGSSTASAVCRSRLNSCSTIMIAGVARPPQRRLPELPQPH